MTPQTLNDTSASGAPDRPARPTSSTVRIVATILTIVGGVICFSVAVRLPFSSSGIAVSALAVVLGSCGLTLGGLTLRHPLLAGIIELVLGYLCVIQAVATLLLHTRGTVWLEGRSPSYFYFGSAVLFLSAAVIALGAARHTPPPTPTGGTP